MGYPHGDTSTYQEIFDPRHRTVGVMAKGVDVFAGVQFKGFIYPVTPPKAPVVGSLGSGFAAIKAADPRVAKNDDFGGTMTGGSTVNFLYNPSSITVDYSATAELLPAATLAPSQIGQPSGNNGPTYSFDILFDRTYEVCDGSQIGVLTDILALERLCGITPDAPPMVLSPVVIGLAANFIIKALLTGMRVQYTHFSRYMVPMRCGVSITATRISNLVSASQDVVDAYKKENPETKITTDAPASQTASSSATTTTTAAATTTTTTTTSPSKVAGPPAPPPAYALPAFGVPR